MPSNKKLLQAAAGNAGESLYVEDVFSTFLYGGNSSTQVISNGLDLDGEGGSVWLKDRFSASLGFHMNYSTLLGTGPTGGRIFGGTASTNGTSTQSDGLQSYNSTGFTLGANTYENGSGKSFVSWSFRKAEKFFDVVTWTGNGAGTRTVAHNLGVLPGMIIVKRTDSTSDWLTYNSNGSLYKQMSLNSTAANNSDKNYSEIATDSTLDVAHMEGSIGIGNANGATYVAYLFASDAGGFGDDGDENIIKCGSYTTDGAGKASVNLGWEPQFIITKSSSGTGGWYMFDTMRGLTGNFGTAASAQKLFANATDAESAQNLFSINATGFNDEGGILAGGDFVYIAIRRPMKTPTAGTEVFAISDRPTAGDPDYISGFPVDMGFHKSTNGSESTTSSRLQGERSMLFNNTSAEISWIYGTWDWMNGWSQGSGASSVSFGWMFRRAPGFMDVVVADAPGYAWTNQPHNLGVVPELLIYKSRAVAGSWYVMSSALASSNYYMGLNNNNAATLSGASQYSATATTVSYPSTPTAGSLLSYLFATLAGISKVGNYTGTGADLNVDCGFTAGARFILIKRTDSTGDWYYWDSVRGISAGNDPYLLLNTMDAQVTNTDYIDPLASGFTVTSSAPDALNASSGTYIFLAIA